MNNTTSLVPVEAAYTAVEMVRPIINPHDAAEAIRQYEALKAAIRQPQDVHREKRKKKDDQGKLVDVEVEYLKKSYWRRIARCFGLTLELVNEARGFDEGGHLFYSVIYRAVAPNGQGMIGDGYCSRAEPGHQYWPEHSVRATAHTRAKNRAISDMVGGGEVSAEEMPGGDAYIEAEAERKALPAPAQTRPAPAQQASRTAAPAPAKASVKPAPAPTQAADESEPPWAAMRSRIRAIGMTGRSDVNRLCEQVGIAGGWEAASTWDHYHRIDRRITALEGARASAEAKIAQAAQPAEDSPNEANGYDLTKLAVPGVRP